MQKENSWRVDFIGIGAAKCATTWIAACLGEHPQICMSRPKETNFFCNPYSWRWYKSCFKHCQPGQIKGEFSISYMTHPETAQRIKNHNPDVKIIACLRNPIERTYSHYFHSRSCGEVNSFLTFEEAIERAKKKGDIILKGSFYYPSLKEFYRIFPKENILVLFYEDIQKDPAAFIQGIYKFLGVDENILPANLNKRMNVAAKRRVRVPFLNLLFSLIVHWGTREDAHPFSRMVYRFLKQARGDKVAKLVRKLNRRKEVEKLVKPPMSPETREYLQTLFSQDIQNLEGLMGKDLSFWR